MNKVFKKIKKLKKEDSKDPHMILHKVPRKLPQGCHVIQVVTHSSNPWTGTIEISYPTEKLSTLITMLIQQQFTDNDIVMCV